MARNISWTIFMERNSVERRAGQKYAPETMNLATHSHFRAMNIFALQDCHCKHVDVRSFGLQPSGGSNSSGVMNRFAWSRRIPPKKLKSVTHARTGLGLM